MTKKIVAIGGGENGRKLKDGTYAKYETGPIDEEIIKLTGKEHPNFLFLGHAQPIDHQKQYFKCMRDIYNKRYGCAYKTIRSDELDNEEKVDKLIEWADIIYEGGGNTLDMIEMWKSSGFDKKLEKAWKSGKVMCGVSAGGNCWFESCSSDSLKIKYGPNQPFILVDCLGFAKGVFVPHCDEKGREESIKDLLKGTDKIGLLFSNCSALEIVDDNYRIITSDASNHNIEAYAKKVYWNNNKYIEKFLDLSDNLKPIKDLYKK